MLLALDTTFSACSVAIHDMARGLGVAARLVPMDKGHAEALPPMVEACIAEAGIAPSDITRIAVTHGPGTFTGQRIGLAVAHGLGIGLSVPVVGINSLAAMAAPFMAEGRSICVVQKAGATGRFYMLYLRPGMKPGDWDAHAQFCSIADCVAAADDRPLLLGSGADDVLAQAPLAFEHVAGHHFPQAAQFASLAATLPIPPDLPQPLYLREPDAKPSIVAPLVVLRQAVADDVDVLSRLHGQCFDAGWSNGQLTSALSLAGAGALVLEADGAIRGFVQFQVVAGEAEINTLCIEPRWRKRGLAQRLLAGLDDFLRGLTVSKIHLDVADDNVAALALYARGGYQSVGRRKGYYDRGSGLAVDAVLMTRVL